MTDSITEAPSRFPPMKDVAGATVLMFLSWKGGVGRSLLSTMTRWLTDAVLVDLDPHEDSSNVTKRHEDECSGHYLTKSAIFNGSSHSNSELMGAVQSHLGRVNLVFDTPNPGLYPERDALVGELLKIEGMKVLVPVTIGPRLSSTLARTECLLAEYRHTNPSLTAGVVINDVELGPRPDEEDAPDCCVSPLRIAEAVNEVLRSSLPFVGIIRNSEGFASVDPSALDSPAAGDLLSVLQVIGASLGNWRQIPPSDVANESTVSYAKEMFAAQFLHETSLLHDELLIPPRRVEARVVASHEF